MFMSFFVGRLNGDLNGVMRAIVYLLFVNRNGARKPNLMSVNFAIFFVEEFKIIYTHHELSIVNC